MNNPNIKILMVEDDKIDQIAFRRFIKGVSSAYEYTISGSVAETSDILKSNTFDIVITDYMLGDGTAFDIIDLIEDIPVIVATREGDEEIAIKAMKKGASDYIIKDINRNYLKILPYTIESAIDKSNSRKRFSLLFHAIMSIEESVYISDLDNKIIYVNKSFSECYGFNEEEIIGIDSENLCSCFIAPELIEHKPLNIRNCTGKKECLHVCKTGDFFPVLHTKSEIKNDKGTVIAYVNITRDITDKKQEEEELRKAKEAAEASSRTKSQFLANMSHEIMTPINGVSGMLQLLDTTMLTQEQKEYLEMAELSINTLIKVVNAILDFSRLETGKVNIVETEFDLDEVLKQIVWEKYAAAQQKNIDIGYEIDKSTPKHLVGDSEQLGKALLCIVENAVKFTKKGRVEIFAEKIYELFDRVQISISIKDTGIGIDNEKLNLLFESFSQEDGSSTRKYGGLGLGLTISNELIELLGGSIEVKSAKDIGSTFNVIVPFKIAAKK